MFLHYVLGPAGYEFQETERGFYLKLGYLQKPFSYVTKILQIDNYKWHFEDYFSEFHLLKSRKSVKTCHFLFVTFYILEKYLDFEMVNLKRAYSVIYFMVQG
jgi:hypothetical protein